MLNTKNMNKVLEDQNLEAESEAPAPVGDRIRALRKARKMSIASLARTTGFTERAIHYVEKGQRLPGYKMLRGIADALDVSVEYFMDERLFESELNRAHFYEEVKSKYGSAALVQARSLLNETAALFAGGELSESDREAFIEEMEEIFIMSKEIAAKNAEQVDK